MQRDAAGSETTQSPAGDGSGRTQRAAAASLLGARGLRHCSEVTVASRLACGATRRPWRVTMQPSAGCKHHWRNCARSPGGRAVRLNDASFRLPRLIRDAESRQSACPPPRARQLTFPGPNVSAAGAATAGAAQMRQARRANSTGIFSPRRTCRTQADPATITSWASPRNRPCAMIPARASSLAARDGASAMAPNRLSRIMLPPSVRYGPSP